MKNRMMLPIILIFYTMWTNILLFQRYIQLPYIFISVVC